MGKNLKNTTGPVVPDSSLKHQDALTRCLIQKFGHLKKSTVTVIYEA